MGFTRSGVLRLCVKQSALSCTRRKDGDDVMDLYFDDDTVLRALRRYVRLVNEALGLTGECWYVQADDVVSRLHRPG
ncbi:hypothetical protein [Actinophytocola algeriensis]|uniref:Uncharacterized protein n=1 Tax=Actinophytocola algeriensis TaxID=1768010 RepID=A0A7W7VIP7_9PSEU|nr:hypothetical protein [Actinophytocola algeriensis]MBB4911504.1 hypothetical protein [Actinophytocola algeriensis]MBE1473508.1 hypothetical protein [Actinophytocola algeriensis]